MATIGLDYASVDANEKPNFIQAKVAGARFAILRAIYGRPILSSQTGPYRDPIWERDHGAVRSAGLRLGGYLFLCTPRQGAYTPEPEQQAEALAEYAADLKPGDLPPFVDVEEASVLSPDAYYDWVLRACRVLKQRFGAWPGIYGSARVWEEYLGNHEAGELIDCPLWIAKPWPWPPKSPVYLDGGLGYSPKPITPWGDQWLFYQYQGDAIGWPGFVSTVDANRFNTLKPGTMGATVKWLQHRLSVAGYGPLVDDGDFGPKTEAALKGFQIDHGLVDDGVYGVNSHAFLAWFSR